VTDFSTDPRFSEIPEWAQKVLKEIEPMPVPGGDTWHEVGFRMANFTCQAAVVNGKWVALPPEQIAEISLISYVFNEDGEKLDINKGPE
jgi:hypothetical protein